MPVVSIKVIREEITPEKKEQLIAEVTRVVAAVLARDPQTTVVIVDEVEPANWGAGGQSVSARRQGPS